MSDVCLLSTTLTRRALCDTLLVGVEFCVPSQATSTAFGQEQSLLLELQYLSWLNPSVLLQLMHALVEHAVLGTQQPYARRQAVRIHTALKLTLQKLVSTLNLLKKAAAAVRDEIEGRPTRLTCASRLPFLLVTPSHTSSLAAAVHTAEADVLDTAKRFPKKCSAPTTTKYLKAPS